MTDFDIVVYGASGFTGRQAARHLAAHAPAGLRWAVAGRNKAKIESVAEETGAGGVIIADSGDSDSVSAMASRARVVIATAGPFSRYGTPVVAGCVEHGTDYVDITGETPWVRGLIEQYHVAAADSATRIVPFCGFDSVPGDIGALWMAEHFRAQGSDTRRISASYKISGGLNGGTFATMLDFGETGASRTMGDWFLLNPDGYRGQEAPEESRDLKSVVYDETRKTWLLPFVMAAVNTRVVRRSNGLLAGYDRPYGKSFVYTEAMESRQRLKAIGITATLGALQGALKSSIGRKVLARLGPSPGQGPSEETMNGGFTRVQYVGQSEAGKKALGTWKFQGDPGNRFTVMALCESALLLATDRDVLPGGETRGGVLTPATALGLPLLDRMRARGLETTLEDL